MQVVSNFIDNYFDQNPISQLAIVELRDGYAEKISELSGNARHHKKKLEYHMSSSRQRGDHPKQTPPDRPSAQRPNADSLI